MEKVRLRPDGWAIASLVLGICGLLPLPIIGSILAILFARRSIRRTKLLGEPNQFARAGLVLGIVGLGYLALTPLSWLFTSALGLLDALLHRR